MSIEVAEIRIENSYLAYERGWQSPNPSESVTQVSDVLQQLQHAWTRGAHVVLLSINSLGGSAAAGYVLYDALRSFSEAGGTVVCYVAGWAGSSAAQYVLGADYVVANPRAVIYPHGLFIGDGFVAREPAGTTSFLREAAERHMEAVLATHTAAEPIEIACWLSRTVTAHDPGGERLDAKRARDLAYVDIIGSRQRARDLARKLASGVEVSTPRRERLRGLARANAYAVALQEVRGLGASFGSRLFSAAVAPTSGAYDLVTDRDVQNALLRRVGADGVRVLEAHLRDVANDLVIPDGGAGALMWIAKKTRTGLTGAVFAFNIGQTLQNLSGFGNVLDEGGVPPRFLKRGLWRYLHDRGDAIEFAVLKSGEMATRRDHFDRDIGDELRRLIEKRSDARNAIDGVKEMGIAFFSSTDKFVSTVTWLGAYEHGTAPKEKGGLGLSEELAVRNADRVVRTKLAAARTVDLPAFMRDPRLRLVTMFAGWANGQLNQLMGAGHDARQLLGDQRYRRAFIRFTKTWILLGLTASASELLTGRAPQDRDDDGLDAGDVGRWMAVNAFAGPLLWAPWIGAHVRAIRDGRNASLTPWDRGLEEGGKAIWGAWKLADQLGEDGEVDPDALSREALQTLSAAGYFTGLPVAQVRATGGYVAQQLEDQGGVGGALQHAAANPGEAAVGLAFGKKRQGTLGEALFGSD